MSPIKCPLFFCTVLAMINTIISCGSPVGTSSEQRESSTPLTTASPLPQNSTKIPSATPAPSASPTFAEQVFTLTNAYRLANGAEPLLLNSELNAAAQAFAESMATLQFFDHTAPDGSTPGDRMAAAGYNGWTWGENIAYGYNTPDQVMKGWINSSGHRANILSKNYKDIGIGYTVSNKAGNTAYWVQDFGAN